MTRTYNDRRNEITASAGQTDFTYDWRLDNQADVVVTHKVNSTGAVSTLTITTEYTVAGVGVAGGGTITLVTGAAVNDLIILEDNRQPERTQDYSTSGDLLADSLDGDQDRRVDIMMNHERQLDRSLHLAPIELNAVSMEIPVAVAGEAWRWDAAGTAIEHFTPQGDPADDVGMCFGTDADFCIVYDSAADALEIRNEAGTPLITITDTSNTFAQNSTFSGTLASGALTVTGLMQSTTAGIGIARTDGTLHVHTASCGAQSAPAAADDLVVENNASGGMTILTPDAASSEIVFGSPSRQTGAFIDWRFGNLAWQIGTATASAKVEIFSGNGVLAMTLNSTQDVEIPSGTLTVNSDTDGTTILGRVKIGTLSVDRVAFSHFDHFTTTNFAVEQSNLGTTSINSAAGQLLEFSINNIALVSMSGTTFTFNAPLNVVMTGDLRVDGGDITSISGAIAFGNENLSTTGTLASGALTVTGNAIISGDLQVNGGDITSTTGAIAFGNENLSTTGTLTVNSDTDGTTILGRAKIGSVSTDQAVFSHFDHNGATDYGFLHTAAGLSRQNAASGQTSQMAVNNTVELEVSATVVTIATNNLTVTAGLITASSDVDSTHILGRAKISSPAPDIAYFSHFDRANTTDYAVRQNADGFTRINSAVGQVLDFLIGNAQELILSNTDLTLPTNDFTVTEGDIDITAGNLTVGAGIFSVGAITVGQGRDTASGADIGLFFGTTNQKQLRWDISDQGFLFSDDLRIIGGLTVSSLAGSGSRTVVADANGVLSAP